MRAASIVVVGVMFLTAGPAAFGQQSAVEKAQEQYVPRSEYERLKEAFEKLQRQVEQIQKQTSTTTERRVQQGIEEKKEFGPSPESELRPGWERRVRGRIGSGHRDAMDVRIANTGDMDLFMGVDTVGRFQYLAQGHVADTVGSNSTLSGPLSPGFQTAYGNFSFLADFDRWLEVYFSVFIADSPHPDKLQGDEGYMLIRELPDSVGKTRLGEALFDAVDIKAGQFELDFGDAHYRRSINAAVQRNPLIGNYVVDPRSTEIGVEVSGDEGRFPADWLIGVGSGGETGDFQKNHGLSLHGKVGGRPAEQLNVSSSIYWVDQSDSPISSRTNLFRANRSGGPYAGVLDNSAAPGEVFLTAGQNVLAAQFDATWEGNPLEGYAHIGWVQDSDTNGNAAETPKESWLYYAAEGTYHVTDRLYTAARYSGAAAQHLVSAASSSRDVNSDGFVHRIQVGGGYWLTKAMLLKAEYVYQLYTGFSSNGSQVSGVDVWNDPSFQGVITEASFAF